MYVILLAAVLAAVLPGRVLATMVLSDGSDGAFNPTASQTIVLDQVAPDGIFNFTTINIPDGVTIRFASNAANTPVFFAATSNVVIDGTIDISAGHFNGVAGPGGGAGGAAGGSMIGAGSNGAGASPGAGGVSTDAFSALGQAGGGGGMATAGLAASTYSSFPPAPGGIAVDFPEPVFEGGSGGGGGGRGRFFGVDLSGGVGGGGGGALNISTPMDITIGGSLLADGGHAGWAFANVFSHGGPGGGGSGGNFELHADSIVLEENALISAIGGAGGGLSTQPVPNDPFVFSSRANGGLGYASFDANVVVIDPDAVIDAAALGIGPVEPGLDPDTPILPDPPVGPDTFVFSNPTPGRWYDPPFVDGFDYAIDGDPAAQFTEVDVPPASFGFSAVDVVVGGTLVATLSPGGGGFDFISAGLLGVQAFSLVGIDPVLDASDPGFPTAFPTFLDWSGSPTRLTMTGIVIPSAGLPEPYTAILLAVGLIGAGCARSRRRR